MNNVSNSSRDNTGNITLGFSESQPNSIRLTILCNTRRPCAEARFPIDEYLIAIDLSASWDWKTNISETALKKTSNPTTGSTVPSLVRGALYQGAANDSNIYLYGGTTSYINTSFPGWQPPSPSTYSLWSYNTVSKKWDQFDTTSASPYRPNSGAYTEAPDQGLAFYFNGEIDSGSSTATQVLGDFVKIFLTGMIVIDTSQHTVRNLSTNAVSGDQPRTRGRLQYVPGIGEKGILVSFGGSQKQVTELDNMEVGNLVRTITIVQAWRTLIRYARLPWTR